MSSVQAFRTHSPRVQKPEKIWSRHITTGLVEARLQALESNWAKFEAQDDKLVIGSWDALAGHDYRVKDLASQAEEAYLNQKDMFLDALYDLNSEASVEILVTAPDSSKDASITKVEKLHYLKSCLKGEADLLVRSLPTTGENFERAWKSLTDHFENKRQLVRSYISKFTTLQKLKGDSSSDLRDLCHCVRSTVGSLESIGRPITSSEDLFVHLIVELLDLRSRHEWENTISETTKPPSYEELQRFLDRRVNTLKSLQPMRAEASSSKISCGPARQTHSLHARNQKSKRGRCSLCGKDHYIMLCDVYQSKTAEARKQHVEAHNLCFNCLGKHKLTECTSKKTCSSCHARHHTTLHDACSNSEVATTLHFARHQPETPTAAGSFQEPLDLRPRLAVLCRIEENLTGLVQRFWQQEELSVEGPPLTLMDQECENFFLRTHDRCSPSRRSLILSAGRPPLSSEPKSPCKRPGCKVSGTPPSFQRWLTYQSELPLREQIRVPRWIGPHSPLVKLHGFADASERAYAAVIYLRIKTEATWSISLLTSKTKVAPIKQVTLPPPFLDNQGILRVGGRLKHAILAYDERHPAIMPGELTLSKLIVEACHRRALHGGVQLTLGMIRQRYWIPRSRAVVKGQIFRPFLHTGLDYAGPIWMRTSKGRGQRAYKAFIAVFVCLSTRAVHLEAVSDYTAEAFLAALRRFVSRRGLCRTIQSDCGTNFVGAYAQLRALFAADSSEHQALEHHLLADNIKWRFNPPAVPHFGGI
ncbi:hypothetical protein RF55_13588 [Lasius niger]|uniref:Integrase zinc-binding domain-containing protein n=1 Tax=Lasius niger TaxID=67767 RepID=A0A0J7N3B1_LASNI|nr:hypothetical protein RF55_13588 [Lasius niger]